MRDPGFVLLYVSDTPRSTAFYSRLLGRDPVEASPTFAMFALANGLMLGLWQRSGVTPAVAHLGGGSELAFVVGDNAAVDTQHAEWQAAGIAITQSPTDLDFGRSFVGVDDDGHRLRVFCPARG
jgi:catechol 2,3-dioxygenase-like lactoylglutathione lyase family enzyme